MNRWAFVAGVVTIALCMTGQSLANTTNDVPYNESFETYADGTILSGTNGWYGASNAATVVAMDPGFSFGYPLPAETHANILELSDAVENLYVVGETDPQGSTNGVHNPPWISQRTYIDMLVKPVPRDSDPSGLDTNVQCAVYLGAEGLLHVYHRYRSNSGILVPAEGTDEGMWSVLSNAWDEQSGSVSGMAPAIPTNEWFRLTITMGYLTDPWAPGDPGNTDFDVRYQVKVNGTPLAGEWGEEEAFFQGAFGGTWFLAANHGAYGPGSDLVGNPHYYLSAVATEGPGMIDDLVVTADGSAIAGYVSEAYGIPSDVYTSAGVSWLNPDGDDDMDGVSNWGELVAGTDPTSPDSTFAIVNQMNMGDSNVVYFTASNANNLDADITMLRSTEGLINPVWQPIAVITAAQLSPSGTNMFADTTAPQPEKAYYRPVINWVHGQ